MAVGMNKLTKGSGLAGPTASFTPTANALVLAFVVAEEFSSGPNIVLGNGNGLVWTNLYDANIYILNSFNSIGLWYAMTASPSTGQISISGSAANIGWDIIEFTGVSTSGVNGLGAIVQHGQTAVGSPGATATFSSVTDSNNAIVALFGAHDGTVNIGVSGGYTTIDSGVLLSNVYLTAWLNGVSQSSVSVTEDFGSGRVIVMEVGGGGAPAPTSGSPTGLAIGAGF